MDSPKILRPKLTSHPFHPHHSLTLKQYRIPGSENYCSTCTQTKYCTFIYHCDHSSCQFRICWKCSTLRADLVYGGHQHKLCFMENMDEDLECNADYCYFRELKSVPDRELENAKCCFIFRCVPCNFNIVHLLCGPLPPTVNYKNHMHPLDLCRGALTEDQSGEYHCDVCESERDPSIGVYYCKPCKFFAHAHCLIDELASMLMGVDMVWPDTSTERSEGDNEESLNDMEGKTEMTLRDIVYNLSKEEKERFEEHFDWNNTACSSQDSIVGIPEEYYFPRSDMDFQRLFHIFDKYCNFRRLKLESSDLEMRLKKVENYMVGWTLSSHLKKLLKKHGDVSEGSELTPEMKSLGFHFLCKVLYGMNMTILNNIREEHLRDWYGYLKFVTRMGFRIDFVYLKLERAKQAFFDLRAKDLEAKIPKELNDKKSELEKKLAEIDDELQKYKEYRESYTRWKKTSKSYSDVLSQFIWKPATL